ncbi:hypothetical protein ACI2JR_10965 [Klebsiella sp. NPDC088457]
MKNRTSPLTIPVLSAETLGHPGALDDGNAYGIVEMPDDYIYRILDRQEDYHSHAAHKKPGGMRPKRKTHLWEGERYVAPERLDTAFSSSISRLPVGRFSTNALIVCILLSGILTPGSDHDD